MLVSGFRRKIQRPDLIDETFCKTVFHAIALICDNPNLEMCIGHVKTHSELKLCRIDDWYNYEEFLDKFHDLNVWTHQRLKAKVRIRVVQLNQDGALPTIKNTIPMPKVKKPKTDREVGKKWKNPTRMQKMVNGRF